MGSVLEQLEKNCGHASPVDGVGPGSAKQLQVNEKAELAKPIRSISFRLSRVPKSILMLCFSYRGTLAKSAAERRKMF